MRLFCDVWIMKHIPLHKISERVNIGLEIRYYGSHEKIRQDGDILGVHRDDHFIFFVIEEGEAEIMVDFTHLDLPEQSIYYMLPGQVHHRIRSDNGRGWFLAIDTGLIPKEYRDVFDDQLLLQQPCKLTAEKYQECYKLMRLLNDAYLQQTEGPFYLQMVYSLLNYFLGIAATCYCSNRGTQKAASRPNLIAYDFKKLLADNYKTEKSPSAYAAMLNISAPYLNEALKKVTGLPVTYWITHEILLEAKRLLFYTDLTVKEIAHQLGYEDHAYFSRLFKSVENTTPLAFRNSYRR